MPRTSSAPAATSDYIEEPLDQLPDDDLADEPTAPPPAATRPQSSVAAALETFQAEQSEIQRETANYDDETWSLYIAILKRHHNPDPGDAESLLTYIRDFGQTPAQVAEDAHTVEVAMLHQSRHDSIMVRHRELVEAREALKALEKRYETEHREHRRRYDAAQSAHSASSEAGHALLSLARSRPELFTGDNPPRLR